MGQRTTLPLLFLSKLSYSTNMLKNNSKNPTGQFTLYDLRVEVVGNEKKFVCNHKVGDYFELSGENLSFPTGQAFSIYALAALIPLLPAKQRMTDKNDWMTTDAEVACPDPNCGARFRITRTKKRVFKHRDVTTVPLKKRKG